MARTIPEVDSDDELPTAEEALRQAVKRSSSSASALLHASDFRRGPITVLSSDSDEDGFFTAPSKGPSPLQARATAPQLSSEPDTPRYRLPNKARLVLEESSSPEPLVLPVASAVKGKRRAQQTPLSTLSRPSPIAFEEPVSAPSGIIVYEPGPSRPAPIAAAKPRTKAPTPSTTRVVATHLATPRTPARRKPPATPSAAQLARDWAARRVELAEALIRELNEKVFGGRLPPDLTITWNARLNTTAGRAHWKGHRDSDGTEQHDASIELSTKVVDSPTRLANTLAHELAHIAAFMFDAELKPPHGPAFKRWAEAITAARPDIAVRTTHDYEINYKFVWRCCDTLCAKTYSRHSRSINPEQHACGSCRSRLEQIQPVPSPRKRAVAATPKRAPPPTPRQVIDLDGSESSEGEIGELLKRLDVHSD